MAETLTHSNCQYQQIQKGSITLEIETKITFMKSSVQFEYGKNVENKTFCILLENKLSL